MSEKSSKEKESKAELTTHWQLALDAVGLANRIAYAAQHDQLTGMLTKETWGHKLEERLKTDNAFGVVFMDMDSFKKVNDRFGHNRGDALLEQFGTHMRKHFQRSGDTLTHERLFQDGSQDPSMGRVGGDEFGVVIDLSGGIHRSPDTRENMDNSIVYLRSVLDDFVGLQTPEIQALGFNVSLGYAIREQGEHTTASALLEQSDKAMYADKRVHDAAR